MKQNLSIKGFTLLETVLAMVILSSGLILMANSWSGSYMKMRKTKVITEIAALLERKMTEIELECRGKTLDCLADEKEDDFGQEYPQYSWKMESKKLEIPDLSATLTSRDEGADQNMLTLIKTLTDHLNNTIKEVKVTVIYKGGKKGKPYSSSVTTYFVDFEKEIQVPGLGATGGGS